MDRKYTELETSRKTPPDNVSPALWELLDDWEAPRPDAGFDARVMARIRNDQEARQPAASPAAFWRRLPRWVSGDTRWGLAAAVAVLLLASVLLWSPAGLQPAAPDRPLAEFSVQQAEDALEDLRMLEELYAGYAQEEGQNNRL
jgi:negative regulator of sigma E activity